MTDTASTAIAVLAALGAAGSFGVAAALRHRQAQLAPPAASGGAVGPEPALAAVVGAFHAGPLAASLPVMGTVGPACGVLLGTLLFGERLAGSPAAIAVRLAAAVAAIAGITLLGRYPGTAGVRNAANQAGAAAGPQVHAASEPQAPQAGRGRPAAGHRHTWAAR